MRFRGARSVLFDRGVRPPLVQVCVSLRPSPSRAAGPLSLYRHWNRPFRSRPATLVPLGAHLGRRGSMRHFREADVAAVRCHVPVAPGAIARGRARSGPWRSPHLTRCEECGGGMAGALLFADPPTRSVRALLRPRCRDIEPCSPACCDRGEAGKCADGERAIPRSTCPGVGHQEPNGSAGDCQLGLVTAVTRSTSPRSRHQPD